MLAKRAFLHRANPGQRPARVFVQHLGFKNHSLDAQAFKRVAKQQQLGLGIGAAALMGWRQPGRTNFQPEVLKRDVHVAGAANHLICLHIDDHKR